MFLFRFIYIRYAPGLIKEGLQLLHWLTFIFISAFCFHIHLIYPVRYISNGNNYQDSLKGKFCTMTNITNITSINHSELDLKPKLLNFALAFIFFGLMNFYFFSALNQR